MQTVSKKPAPRPSEVGTPTEPTKPSYAEVGREAARVAQREALHRELVAQGWNLSATAKELRMGTASAVIRAIHKLGLSKEYKAAQKRGDIFPGPHGES
jgi:transcriptional regulator with GAF, ATPase, and Fis domain